MAKGSSSLNGLYFQWRSGKNSDAIRAFVSKDGEKPTPISAKIHPQLRALNEYLKMKGARESDIFEDDAFKILKGNFEAAIKSEFGLKTYKVMERLEIDSKDFNYTAVLEEFYAYKENTALPVDYRFYMRELWLPFFKSLGCTHPKDFHRYSQQAKMHVKTCKKLDGSGQRYSPNSYNVLCRTLNQFMEFCSEVKHINESEKFTIWVTITLEQQKVTKSLSGKNVKKNSAETIKKVRDQRTYSLEDLFTIKKKIDECYKRPIDLQKKINAYCLYFGVITGLRKGNYCGLLVRDILPDEPVPYFIVRDNIISGRSRGISGYIIQENATKTSAGSAIEIPMVQPDVKTIVSVAKFIRKHREKDERLFLKTPGRVNKDWMAVAEECGFTYLSPLQWRHSYATIGALNLGTLYKGNSYFLQRCCLHEDYRTTQGYIKKHAKQFLDVFGQVFSPTAGSN